MNNIGSGAPTGAPEFFICRANLIILDMQNAGGVPLLAFHRRFLIVILSL